MRKSDTDTIIGALRVLARDIQTDDGVVNACLSEAAERLEELSINPHEKVKGLIKQGYEIEESAVVIRKPNDNYRRGIVTEFGKVQWFDDYSANNVLRGKAVMVFANTLIDCLNTGFIDTNTLNLASIHKSARDHSIIRYNYIADELTEAEKG